MSVRLKNLRPILSKNFFKHKQNISQHKNCFYAKIWTIFQLECFLLCFISAQYSISKSQFLWFVKAYINLILRPFLKKFSKIMPFYVPYSCFYKTLLNRSPSWIEAAPKYSSIVLKLRKWTNSWIEAAPKGLKN